MQSWLGGAKLLVTDNCKTLDLSFRSEWKLCWVDFLHCIFFPFFILNISCHSLLTSRISPGKAAHCLLGRGLVAFPVLLLVVSLYGKFCLFNYSVFWCGPLYVASVWNSVLCTWVCVCFYQVREVFSSCVFKYVLCLFFSLSFWDPYSVNISALDVSQRSLKFSSFFKFFLLFSLSGFHYSASSSVIHFSESSNPLLIPSTVFFISVIVFFSSAWFFIFF